MERITFQDIPQEMMGKLMDVEQYINKSLPDFKLLELMRLRVAQINGCAYCVDMHFKELRHLNETDLRLSSLSVWEETNYFSDKEIAVLKLTEALTTITNKPISNEAYSSLENHFDKTEISILTLAISQINTWTRLMKTFKITPGNYKVSH
ncbi:carboxymuconolactone decarboxylase family protein [uncultured Croceitalea sp.]|uniref:carboxymuconolactone decarboxylase family protein n=1 Tax=uncultured Croceitalea sp. TaxID=1798908 RepID=UPI0033068AC5